MGHLYHGYVSHSQRVYSVLRTCVIVFMGLRPQDIPRSCGWQGFLHVQKGGDTDGEPPNLKNMDPLKNHATWWSNTRLFIIVYPPEKGVVSTKAGDMSHDLRPNSQGRLSRVPFRCEGRRWVPPILMSVPTSDKTTPQNKPDNWKTWNH